MSESEKFFDPIIFDAQDHSKNIEKPTNPIIFDEVDKNYEEKIFIILYNIEPEEDMDEIYSRVFSVCIGRTEAYFDIKDKLTSGLGINIYTSKIITETKQTETSTDNLKYYMIPYNECLNIYAFCTAVQEFYSDDGFNINDYTNSGSPEDKTDLENSSFFLSPEQAEYKKMLIDSIKNKNRDLYFGLNNHSNNI